jgi:hypothetical protein
MISLVARNKFYAFTHSLIVDEQNYIQENEINISMRFNLCWQTPSQDYFFFIIYILYHVSKYASFLFYLHKSLDNESSWRILNGYRESCASSYVGELLSNIKARNKRQTTHFIDF